VVFLVEFDVGRVVALAQLLPAAIDEQAEMAELGGFPIEGLVQLGVFWCGNKPLLRGGRIRSAELSQGRDHRLTAPRMTWVISMWWSSTTLAKW
jgi:hypothetical protein